MQPFLNDHQRQYRLGNRPLQRVKDSRLAVEDEPLPKKAIKERRQWHQGRSQSEPPQQARVIGTKLRKLAPHILRLRIHPTLYRFPIIVNDS